MTVARYGPYNLPLSPALQWFEQANGGWLEEPEPPARLPDQVNTAYDMLRNGHTEVQVRLAIQEQYGKGAKPTQAFRRGLDLLVQEQRAAREHLPELVMAVRWNAIQRAIQSGQLGAAAAMLRDVGAACGESALDAAGATLLVEVLPPGSGASQGQLGASGGDAAAA
jgi:hypothetical protein